MISRSKMVKIIKLASDVVSFEKSDIDRLSENLKDLLGDKESCDTTLKVEDKEYNVHKALLIARSPVFAAAFKHHTSEKQTGVINISDCDPDSFQHFLEYLYSGKINTISNRDALCLYCTSDKYDVQELKTFCVEFLIKNLSVENFCDTAVMADKYDETKLFSAAQDFFTDNASEVFESSEWEYFMKNNYRLANKFLKAMSKERLVAKVSFWDTYKANLQP